MVDPSGCFAISTAIALGFWIGLAVGAVAGAAAGGVMAYNAAQDSGAEGWDSLPICTEKPFRLQSTKVSRLHLSAVPEKLSLPQFSRQL